MKNLKKVQIQCKWCNQHKVGCKAHIVPEYFFRKINSNGLVRLDRSATQNYKRKSKASPKGLFDCSIICKDCEESVFKGIDNNAINLFFQKQDKLIVINDYGGGQINEFPDLDSKILYSFVLSVLWRASVSGFCPNINLGTYKDLIREEVLNPTFKFKIFITRTLPSTDPYWINLGMAEEATMQLIEPYYVKLPPENVRLYLLHMGNYMMSVCVTNKALNSKLSFLKFPLAQNLPVRMHAVPFEDSLARDHMYEIAKEII